MTAVVQHIQHCDGFWAYNKNIRFNPAELRYVPGQMVD